LRQFLLIFSYFPFDSIPISQNLIFFFSSHRKAANSTE
jgi:hypothetical protein